MTDEDDRANAPARVPAAMPATIAAAREMLRRGDLSATALVTACLARIEAVEPRIRACLVVMADEALAAARAADALPRAQWARAPLRGIPLGIKDLMDTRGVPTTAGSRVLAGNVPQEDASIIARLRAAGAIPLCKTNTHEFAFGTVTPPTRNPWDTERVPGGSSGGSAAGLAAGEFLGALGTDTGGSIRIPAAWCGVTGLKPTFGLVSRAGIIPLSWSLDHAGPLARTVEDVALLLQTLAGYDPRDDTSMDVPLLDFAAALDDAHTPEEAVRGTRIGIPSTYFFDTLDTEVERAVRGAARAFAAMGAVVEEVAVPSELDELFPVYRGIQKPEAYTYHSAMGWLERSAQLYSPQVHANITSGADYSAVDYIRAQRTRRQFTTEMRAVLQRVDALLTATVAVPAPPSDAYESAFTLGGREIVGVSLRCTFPFDLTGQPALTMPCGFTSGGLPIGVQLVAPHFGEATLLRLGHAYQRVTDWHARQPTL